MTDYSLWHDPLYQTQLIVARRQFMATWYAVNPVPASPAARDQARWVNQYIRARYARYDWGKLIPAKTEPALVVRYLTAQEVSG